MAIPIDEERGLVWDPALEAYVETADAATRVRGITVECPRLNDNFTLFFTNVEITIRQLNFVLAGTTDLTVFVRSGPDRSVVTDSVINAGTLVTNTTTGQEVLVFDNAVIPANSWVWVEFTAITDAPGEINISLVYS